MRRTSALGLAAALALCLAGCGESGRTDDGYHNGSGDAGTYDNTGPNYGGTYDNGGTYNGGSYDNGTYGNGTYNNGVSGAYQDDDSLLEDAGDALRNGANNVRDALDDAGDAVRNGIHNARTGLSNGSNSAGTR